MKRIFTTTVLILMCLYSYSQLNVITYNIRYDNKGDAENAWPNRKEALADNLKKESPAIICLQEVLNTQYLFLQSALNNYSSYGVGRDDGMQAGEYAPIFFKKEQFILLDSGTIWLSETPSIPSKGWDAALNRIITWVKLKQKKSNSFIYVFNTHFDHQGKMARKESAKLLLNKVKEITNSAPTLICGDFNLTPAEEPYQLIISKDFSDAFQANRVKETYTFTGFRLDTSIAKRIDYLFFNRYFTLKKYQTFNWKKNDSFLSDHLPVSASFMWKD